MTTLPKVQEMDRLINLLKTGKIAVIPTDTIYGIVGSALIPETVEQIYQLRKRAKDKPFIILISSLNDLDKFKIKLTAKQKEFLEKIWPNPVSVILPCGDKDFEYLHKGKKSLAFRMPKEDQLLKLLKEVGPLVAPSANFAGEKSAETISEAKKYFQDQVKFYWDKGNIQSPSSTLIELDDHGDCQILRGSKNWS